MVDCIYEMVNYLFFMVKKKYEITKMETLGFEFLVFKIYL